MMTSKENIPLVQIGMIMIIKKRAELSFQSV